MPDGLAGRVAGGISSGVQGWVAGGISSEMLGGVAGGISSGVRWRLSGGVSSRARCRISSGISSSARWRLSGGISGTLLLVLLVVLFFVTPVSAKGYEDSAPNDYITEHFDVKVVFDTAHKASITEKISVDFIQSHHGIVRDIPIASDHSYEIKNVRVPGYRSDTETEGDYLRIKVGDADISLTGKHDYEIHYDIVYYADSSKENDYLAQNLLPTGWETSIRHSTLKLVMPKPIDWSSSEIYFGEYGSDSTDWQSCFTAKTGRKSLTLTGEGIPLHYGLTVRDVHLPEGYWSDAKSYAEAHAFRFGLIFILFAIAAVCPPLMWFKWGRDVKVVETVEFYPPDNLTPAEVGYAMDGILDDEEMMTMFLYFAQKGYVEIDEKKNKSLELKKAKAIADEEPEFAREMFNGLFSGRRLTASLRKLPSSFASVMESAKGTLEKDMDARHGRVHTEDSMFARAGLGLLLIIAELGCGLLMGNEMVYAFVIPVGMQVCALMLLCTGVDSISQNVAVAKLFFGILLYVLGILLNCFLMEDELPVTHIYLATAAQVILAFFCAILMRRDKENAALLGRLRGFRRFIRMAEYDKLVALSDENPQYYYDILPYAAVFGMDTKWTKKFTDIKIPDPSWYHAKDPSSFVYSAALSHAIVSSCKSAAPTPPPSSSSGGSYSGGSSGGGFSGGGGGGGGGGAW